MANAYFDKGHPVTIIALRDNGGLIDRLNQNVKVVVLHRRLIRSKRPYRTVETSAVSSSITHLRFSFLQ